MRLLLLRDKVRNDNVSYEVKRHCLLQDIFSKKTLSVPTVSVETLLVVRHFLFLSKKTWSVGRYFQFWGIFSFYQKDIVRYEIFSVLRQLQFFIKKTLSVMRWFQFSDICSFQTLSVVWHLQLSDTFIYTFSVAFYINKGCPIFLQFS